MNTHTGIDTHAEVNTRRGRSMMTLAAVLGGSAVVAAGVLVAAMGVEQTGPGTSVAGAGMANMVDPTSAVSTAPATPFAAPAITPTPSEQIAAEPEHP